MAVYNKQTAPQKLKFKRRDPVISIYKHGYIIVNRKAAELLGTVMDGELPLEPYDAICIEQKDDTKLWYVWPDLSKGFSLTGGHDPNDRVKVLRSLGFSHVMLAKELGLGTWYRISKDQQIKEDGVVKFLMEQFGGAIER